MKKSIQSKIWVIFSVIIRLIQFSMSSIFFSFSCYCPIVIGHFSFWKIFRMLSRFILLFVRYLAFRHYTLSISNFFVYHIMVVVVVKVNISAAFSRVVNVCVCSGLMRDLENGHLHTEKYIFHRCVFIFIHRNLLMIT